jgi:hypothetical protein
MLVCRRRATVHGLITSPSLAVYLEPSGVSGIGQIHDAGSIRLRNGIMPILRYLATEPAPDQIVNVPEPEGAKGNVEYTVDHTI